MNFKCLFQSTLNPDAAEFVPLATRSLNNASVVVASTS